MLPKVGSSIYFIAISGMGMLPLALYLNQQGYRVSGTDDTPTDRCYELLKKHAVTLDTESLETASLCIYSNAIDIQHPLLMRAQALGIPCIKRGILLAEVCKHKKLIAVVGSHGKTTTTALLIHLLNLYSFKINYILGGLFEHTIYEPYALTNSEWMLAEVDESDGTIHAFSPYITLALNFDWDHCSFYKTIQDLHLTFEALFKRTQHCVLLPDEDAVLTSIAISSATSYHTFLTTLSAEASSKYQSAFKTLFPKHQQSAFNYTNFKACLSILDQLEIHWEASTECIQSFPGVWRRQSILYQDADYTVLTDYAHHPTEVKALLEFYQSYITIPLTVIFEPHRYSRTAQYAESFAKALSGISAVHLLPVYGAHETLNSDGTTQCIYAHMQNSIHPVYNWASWEVALDYLSTSIQTPAYILFIGAGTIINKALAYVNQLKYSITETVYALLITHLNPKSKLCIYESLYDKSTFRIGGKSRFFAQPADVQDLKALLNEIQNLKLSYYVLGRASNVLIPDEGFDGVVIRLNQPIWQSIHNLEYGRIQVGAGTRLQSLCTWACTHGLAGFEFLEGIPGSLGGALAMNAGAMGGWIFDLIESIQFLDSNGTIHSCERAYFHPGYRSCPELATCIVLSAILKSTQIHASEAIRQQLAKYSTKRKLSQPREASLGSIFINPDHLHAGKLIETAGLKGFEIGGAKVSPIHANFIVNTGRASAKEVIELMQHIRKVVQAQTGIILEPEIKLLGKDWKDVL